MNIVIITILLALGIMFFFVGSLISAATALGNNHRLMGWGTILFVPLSLVYCAMHWDKAAYPGRMVFGGMALILIGLGWFVLTEVY